MSEADITIRKLTLDDLEAIDEIDRLITGNRDKIPLWRENFGDILPNYQSIGAVIDNQLVGYIAGNVSVNFGVEEQVGYITVLGIHPKFQGKGIGRRLGQELVNTFKEKGCKSIRTVIPWDAGDLLAYFKSMGMSPSNELTLAMNIED